MKLYINGDSHAAAAEAVCPHAFAEDDGALHHLGRAPHPANLAVSYGKCLADMLKAVHHTDAESASSNQRIFRTTRSWITANQSWLSDTVVVIQWSTWEREEWILDGKTYQITASGTDDVPQEYQDRYRHWIAELNWQHCVNQQHEAIWALHQELASLNVRHVFFNGNNDFSYIPAENRRDWGINYIDPYDSASTFDSLIKQQGFQTVSFKSWHYGEDAHAWWAKYLRKYLVANKMI